MPEAGGQYVYLREAYAPLPLSSGNPRLFLLEKKTEIKLKKILFLLKIHL